MLHHVCVVNARSVFFCSTDDIKVGSKVLLEEGSDARIKLVSKFRSEARMVHKYERLSVDAGPEFRGYLRKEIANSFIKPSLSRVTRKSNMPRLSVHSIKRARIVKHANLWSGTPCTSYAFNNANQAAVAKAGVLIPFFLN